MFLKYYDKYTDICIYIFIIEILGDVVAII